MALWNLTRMTIVMALFKGDYYLIASLLHSNADVCAFSCAKSLKLNQEARFEWISRFEALQSLC
jgi:hypothetical protein